MYRRVLRNGNGIARTSDLAEAGLTRHRLDRQISAGRLIRVARGWIAQPDTDPALVFAARHGLVLSCITQAARLGLWVADPEQKHFAVPRPGAEKRPPGARLHYGTPLAPRTPYSLADSLENTLVAVAGCQTFEEAVATWDSALNTGLVEREELEQLPLRGVARRVLDATDPFADSGLESYVKVRTRGFRLPVRSQVWLCGHRVDFLIGDRLVLQIDGGHHVGAQRTSDNRHDAELRLRGYTVFRVGYTQVMHNWPEIHELIARAIARGLHRAR